MSDIERRLDELEDRVDEQEATIARQQETIERQREELAELRGQPTAKLDRRTALKAGGLLALVGAGSGVASADPRGQVGREDDPLRAVHTATLDGPVTGPDMLTSIRGTGLTVDDSSTLSLADGGVDSTQLAADAVDTDAVADDAIGSPALADSAVDTATVAQDAIGSSQLAPGAVTESEVTESVSGVDVDGSTVSSIQTSAVLSTDVDGDTVTLDIDREPQFDVTIDDVDITDFGATVVVNSVDYTVENIGFGSDTQTVSLKVESPAGASLASDSESVQLGPIGSTSSTLSVDYNTASAALKVLVSSADDTESQQFDT